MHTIDRRTWTGLVAWMIAATGVLAIQTQQVELGYDGSYDGTVTISRDASGRIVFQDNEITTPLTLNDLRISGIDHGGLVGLNDDDHPHYLTTGRHEAAHTPDFNNKLPITADADGNTSIGAHAQDTNIHLKRSGAETITGDWIFSGTPELFNGLRLSNAGAAGSTQISFEAGSSDAQLLWDNANGRFALNRPLSVTSLTSGTWAGTAIDATKGGTGQTAVALGDLLWGSAANTWGLLSMGPAGYLLAVNSARNGYTWVLPSTAGVTDPLVPSDGTQNVTGALMTSGRMTVNGATTSGTLDVVTAASGASSVYSSAKDIVVQNSGDAGISIISPTGRYLAFADTSYPFAAGIYYYNGFLYFRSNNATVGYVSSSGGFAFQRGLNVNSGLSNYDTTINASGIARAFHVNGSTGKVLINGNSTSITPDYNLDVRGTVGISGNTTFSANAFFTPYAQTISAATNTISSSYRQVDVSLSADVTLTSLPSITYGSVEGQLLTLYNKSSAYSLTLSHSYGTGTHVWIPCGASTYVLGPYRTATFRWDTTAGASGSCWVLQQN